MKRPSNSNRDLETYLNAEEVADLLRTSRKAIYSMIERHQIPGVTRIGRRVLIHERSLLQWLDGLREMEARRG
jgi:excisionase family DNA binding protein